MSEPDLTFATLDPGTDERFVSLRRQLRTRARNWTTALLAFKIHFGDRVPDTAN